jgi:ribosome biogenesis protein BMS1
MDGDTAENKVHRKRAAGPKAVKKKAKKGKDETLNPKQRNPKAFAFHSVDKVSRKVRR